MAIWFVSRHPGAVEWARDQGLQVDRWQAHLDVNQIMPGDTVAGSLPANLAAEVCARGATYLHLTLELPQDLRGQELNLQQMRALDARLTEMRIEVVRPKG